KTAFTAVMEDAVSKERTFYAYRGANALFCEDDIDWDRIDSAFFHIGYILLLDALDQSDGEYGTKMARLLCHARERGMRTSVDVVSETGDRFRSIVPPALRYADYCVINEIEAGQISGIPLRDRQGCLIAAHLPEALRVIQNFGVSRWAVIHSPEGGFGLDQKGEYVQSPAADIAPGAIKKKTGAGDAFCAGILYAAINNKSLEEALKWGNAAAAAHLQTGSAGFTS
ncbi:MAG: PfkB family carbohydrate kinase, partial [Treponema sp.]|nr:PfkB family carbohydrate kinase [Treponema sp.]